MTEDEKKEGNRIIQEWMGWKLEPITLGNHTFYDFIRYDEKGNKIDEYDGGNSHSLNKDSIIRYDYHWNLLMGVVEEIESLTYRFTISTTFVRVHTCKKSWDDVDEYHTSVFDGKLNTTWYAVVEFIKWHKEQNKK